MGLTFYGSLFLLYIVRKTFEYRLYPTPVQRQMLLACLRDSRHLYNRMLEMVKAHYEQTGKFLGRYDLTTVSKDAEVSMSRKPPYKLSPTGWIRLSSDSFAVKN